MESVLTRATLLTKAKALTRISRQPKSVCPPLALVGWLLFAYTNHLFLQKILAKSPSDEIGIALSYTGIFVQSGFYVLFLTWLSSLFATHFFRGLCLWLPLLALADFALYNHKGLHFYHLWALYNRDGFEHLASVITFSGVDGTTISLFSALLVLSLLFSMWISLGMERVGRFEVSSRRITLFLLAALMLGLTCAEQAIGLKYKNPLFSQAEQSGYPYYFKAVSAHSGQVFYKVSLDEDYERPGFRQAVFAPQKAPSSPQHVFFVVLESARGDLMTEDVTPELAAFRKQNVSSSRFYSNSNATGNSWFSLFHGRLPFYIKSFLSSPERDGSPAIQALKDLGFDISIITASDLHFAQSVAVNFGENYRLVDKVAEDFGEYPDASDQRALASLEKHLRDLDVNQSQITFFFLESAHHVYFWPKSMPIKFKPIATRIDHFKLRYDTSEVERVKNRYKQALSFVDTSFHRFSELLKKKGIYDDAYIVVVGDHGEEFMEKGEFTHAGHIVEEQFRAYFAAKLPGRGSVQLDYPVSQVQIWPTLFAEMGIDFDPGMFDGRSLFGDTNPVQVISGNAGFLHPTKYAVVNGDRKLHLELRKTDAEDRLYLIKETDLNDRPLGMDLTVHRRAEEWDSLYRSSLQSLPFIRRLSGPHLN